MKIRKIPLQDLLDTLEYLFEIGVDYIDFSGEQGDEQDALTFSFTKDYVNEEFKDDFTENESQEIELNNNSLNDLT